MKFQSIKLSLFAMLFAGLAMPFAFTSCGDDDDDGGDNGGNNGGNDKTARALTVSIDESGLTYEDLTIHLSNNTDYVYENAPFGTVKVTLEDLPTSVAELKKLKLPNGMKDIHETPYLTPALMVAAINQLTKDRDEARNMLDYIAKGVQSENRDGKMVHYPGKGATQVYVSDWNQLKQWTNFDKVRSWFDGALFKNNYTTSPWTMTITLNDYSYTANYDYVQLWLRSESVNNLREYGIWKYDSDGDDEFDYFFGTTLLQLCSGLATYSTDY